MSALCTASEPELEVADVQSSAVKYLGEYDLVSNDTGKGHGPGEGRITIEYMGFLTF